MFGVCSVCHNIYTTGVDSHKCSEPVLRDPQSGNTPSLPPHPYVSPRGRKAPIGSFPSQSQNPFLPGDNQKILAHFSGTKALRLDQPIVGFRAWKVDAEYKYQRLTPFSPVRKVPTGLSLRSAAVGDFEWKINEPLKAECHSAGRKVYHKDISPPTSDCSCGLYAYRTIMTDPHKQYVGGEYSIWGAVLMWGKVFGHSNGFRSEFAQILCLAESEGAHFYAKENPIPVVPKDGIYLYAREFGIVMEEGLL